MKIIPFAARNVGRNRTRSLVTILAMAFAGAVMIVYVALLEGLLEQMEKNVIELELGDLQLHAPGYRSDPDLYKRIESPDEIMAMLTNAGFNSTPRLYGFGLVAAGKTSAGAMLRGITLEKERTVTRIHERIRDGEWLSDTDPHGIVLGGKLAKSLGAGLGSEIVVVSQAADGSMANDLYHVRGILRPITSATDSSGFFMTEPAFRALMGVRDGVHEITVAARKDSPAFLLPLTGRAAKVAELAPGLELKTWRELQPVIARVLDISRSSMVVIYLINYAAIGMVIMNAMLMNVFERIRELGVLKSLGVKPWQIAALVLTETGVKSVAAAVIAIAAGLPFALYLEKYGFNIGRFVSGGSAYGISFEPIWYGRITIRNLLEPVLYLNMIALIGAIYPSIKAAMIKPIDAVHHT